MSLYNYTATLVRGAVLTSLVYYNQDSNWVEARWTAVSEFTAEQEREEMSDEVVCMTETLNETIQSVLLQCVILVFFYFLDNFWYYTFVPLHLFVSFSDQFLI